MKRPVLEFRYVLYNSVSLSNGQAIESIQRQSAIICTGAYRHTCHSTLLSELGWDVMADSRYFYKLCIFYKYFHQIYPPYLYNHLHFSTPSTITSEIKPLLHLDIAGYLLLFTPSFPHVPVSGTNYSTMSNIWSRSTHLGLWLGHHQTPIKPTTVYIQVTRFDG